MNKQIARLRRAKKSRANIKQANKPWVTVYRSGNHIYLQVLEQVIGEAGKRSVRVIVCASSLEKSTRDKFSKMKKTEIAKEVGNELAKRAVTKGITVVAFDRSGYKYHGRVKAAAEGAREGGLIF